MSLKSSSISSSFVLKYCSSVYSFTRLGLASVVPGRCNENGSRDRDIRLLLGTELDAWRLTGSFSLFASLIVSVTNSPHQTFSLLFEVQDKAGLLKIE